MALGSTMLAVPVVVPKLSRRPGMITRAD
jgi:hypothetical protein